MRTFLLEGRGDHQSCLVLSFDAAGHGYSYGYGCSSSSLAFFVVLLPLLLVSLLLLSSSSWLAIVGLGHSELGSWMLFLCLS